MNEFYEATGGVTLLVIKNNGNTFDYVNGYRNNQYFPKWDEYRPYMNPGCYYAVACRVRLVGDKVSLSPFGIAFECTAAEATALSFEHRSAVLGGAWDAQEEYLRLRADCEVFAARWREQMLAASRSRHENFLIQLANEREAMLCRIQRAGQE